MSNWVYRAARDGATAMKHVNEFVRTLISEDPNITAAQVLAKLEELQAGMEQVAHVNAAEG